MQSKSDLKPRPVSPVSRQGDTSRPLRTIDEEQPKGTLVLNPGPGHAPELTEKAELSPCGPYWVDRDCRPDESRKEVRDLLGRMDEASGRGGSMQARIQAITDVYVKFIGSLGSKAHDHELVYDLQRAHSARSNALQIEQLVADNIEPSKTFLSGGFKKTLVQALVSAKPATPAAKIYLAEMVFKEFERQLAGPANDSVLSVMKTELSKWKDKWTAEATAGEKVVEFQTRVRNLMRSNSTKKSLKWVERCTPAEIIEINARLEGDAARNVHQVMKARLTASEASGPIGGALDQELASALMKLGNPIPQLDWVAQYLSDPHST